MKNYLVIDCETSGIDPFANRMITFSAAIYQENDDANKPREKFNYCFTDWKEGQVDPSALKVNNIRLTADNKKFKNTNFFEGTTQEFVQSFSDWVLDLHYPCDYLLGYNINFDITFLKKAFDDSNIKINNLLPYKVIDPFIIATSLIACGSFPQVKSLSAESMYDLFAINSNGIHNADVDVALTWELWQKMSKCFSGFSIFKN